MKKELLVTLADENYIDQAKQLFSGVYFNAGWEGDYMLLAHEIPEEKLKWFRDKGILVKQCRPLSDIEKLDRYPSMTTAKFYLFSKEFKKWQNIIYLDTDIIVRGQLDELAKVKGFAAVSHRLRLRSEFKQSTNGLRREIDKKYNLQNPAFNSGVMAFSTDIIAKNTFNNLVGLFNLYKKILVGEEALLNLFFYKKWKKLYSIYNTRFADLEKYFYSGGWEKIDTIILHFTHLSTKPWNPENYFCKEWKKNLIRAELINLKKTIVPIKKNIRKLKMLLYPFVLSTYIHYELDSLDRAIGLIGKFLKKRYFPLYSQLVRLKK